MSGKGGEDGLGGKWVGSRALTLYFFFFGAIISEGRRNIWGSLSDKQRGGGKEKMN